MKQEKHTHASRDDIFVESGQGGLKEKQKFPWLKSALVLLVVSIVGGLMVWQSYAAMSTASIINTYYNTMVCKDADSGGAAYWGGQYDAAKTTDAKNKVIANLVAQLATTQAYKNRNGAPCPTPAAPQAGTPTTPKPKVDPTSPVSCAAANTTQSSTDKVKGFYKTYLNTTYPDDAGLNYWVTQITTCKKTITDVEAFFKAKQAENKKNPTHYSPKREFPTRKSGESDSQYKSRIAQWLDGEWFNITQGCCGGLNDSYGWAEKIVSGKWTVQQVLDHLNNTTGKNFRDQMASPDSDFAKAFEIRKKIKAAMMERVKAYIASGGTLGGRSPFTDCSGVMEDYNQGYTDGVGPCLEGTGLEMGDEYLWTDKIMSGAVTLEEAIAAIQSGRSATPCIDEMSQYTPSCNSGARWVSGTDLDGYYNGEWDTIREQSRTAPQPGQAGGGFGSSSSTPTSTSTPNVNATTPEEANTIPDSPYASVTSKIKNISSPSSAVTACSGAKCTTLPTGKTKVSEVKADQNTPIVQVADPSSCGSGSGGTICAGNQYSEEWDNSGAKTSTTTTKPANAKEEFTPDELKRCIDQYAKLEPGDDSVCVKVARIYLGLTGYDNVEESTEYDSEMQTAVEDFQSDQSVSNASGIIDKATWDKFKEVTSEVNQSEKQRARDQQVVAEVTNQIQRSNFAILFASCPGQPVLTPGATGDCVRRVQQILALVQVAGLPITGKLDDNTKNALKEYQTGHNLKATGIVDKDTWKLLEASRNTETYRSPFKAESGTVVNNR